MIKERSHTDGAEQPPVRSLSSVAVHYNRDWYLMFPGAQLIVCFTVRENQSRCGKFVCLFVCLFLGKWNKSVSLSRINAPTVSLIYVYEV